jgi:hypothetical protein
VRLWILADQNTVDGDNLPIIEAFMDRFTPGGGKEFAVAMCAVG